MRWKLLGETPTASSSETLLRGKLGFRLEAFVSSDTAADVTVLRGGFWESMRRR